jgi:RNA polymerase sigma-70 factor (ECF subfamily)
MALTDWQSIVFAHGPMAFDTAWRLLGHAADAEDVVQEALLDAFELHSRRAVRNWGGLLRHLASRRAIDRLRQRRHTQALAVDPATRPSDQPESAAIDREAGVFSLRYFGEMSNPQIAEELGISLDAVGVALHKARTRLKQLLNVPAAIAARRIS